MLLLYVARRGKGDPHPPLPCPLSGAVHPCSLSLPAMGGGLVGKHVEHALTAGRPLESMSRMRSGPFSECKVTTLHTARPGALNSAASLRRPGELREAVDRDVEVPICNGAMVAAQTIFLEGWGRGVRARMCESSADCSGAHR